MNIVLFSPNSPTVMKHNSTITAAIILNSAAIKKKKKKYVAKATYV